MAGRFRKRGAAAPAELDVTTFMNLMVVLVPFLLMSAAFSELAIHELNLPTISEASASPSNDRKELTLEVIIRNQHLDVIDRSSGRIKLIPNTAKGHDYVALNDKLKEIKAAYPHVSAVTLLLDPDVQYEKLISTMDAVRGYQVKGSGPKPEKRDLFPDVSIGDAPRVEGGAS